MRLTFPVDDGSGLLRRSSTSAFAAAGGLACEWWTQPGGPVMQDAVLVSGNGPGLRAAAIDGVTPADATPSVAGVDGGRYAARLIEAALEDHRAALDVLGAVNGHLFSLGPDLLPRFRPQACVAVADCVRDGDVVDAEVTVCGDAEAWARVGTTWELVAGGPGTPPELHEPWNAQRRAAQAAGLTRTELHLLEAAHFSDESAYRHAPIGRFSSVRAETVRVRCDELVLASDGALLDAGRVADLPSWLAELRVVEAEGVDRSKATDDATVVRVAPAF